jgi:hypothetical protein
VTGPPCKDCCPCIDLLEWVHNFCLDCSVGHSLAKRAVVLEWVHNFCLDCTSCRLYEKSQVTGIERGMV